MTAATLTTTTRTTRPRDWYAVRVAPPVPRDPRATFTHLATVLAAPVPTDRSGLDAVLTDLATSAGVAHLAPVASDPDVVLHRLAARILARFVDEPDHPALRDAVRRLAS